MPTSRPNRRAKKRRAAELSVTPRRWVRPSPSLSLLLPCRGEDPVGCCGLAWSADPKRARSWLGRHNSCETPVIRVGKTPCQWKTNLTPFPSPHGGKRERVRGDPCPLSVRPEPVDFSSS